MWGGDCFKAAATYLIANFHEVRGLALIHGEAVGRGPIAGVKHGHAWCEAGGEAIDPSNGRCIRMPLELYYGLGQIGDNVKRYTARELGYWVRKTGVWGPWELQTETGL